MFLEGGYDLGALAGRGRRHPAGPGRGAGPAHGGPRAGGPGATVVEAARHVWAARSEAERPHCRSRGGSRPTGGPAGRADTGATGNGIRKVPTPMLDLDQLLRHAVEQRASDVHLKAGSRPYLRVDGRLTETPFEVVEPADTERVALAVMPPSRAEELRSQHEVRLRLRGPGPRPVPGQRVPPARLRRAGAASGRPGRAGLRRAGSARAGSSASPTSSPASSSSPGSRAPGAPRPSPRSSTT